MLKCFFIAGNLFVQGPDGDAINASNVELIDQRKTGAYIYPSAPPHAKTFWLDGPDVLAQIAACADEAEKDLVDKLMH